VQPAGAVAGQGKKKMETFVTGMPDPTRSQRPMKAPDKVEPLPAKSVPLGT
jgi:hypothetical protein